MWGKGFGEIAESLRRSTVLVEDGGTGTGSGVIWRPGTVVTNSHVVRGNRAAITLWDGKKSEAKVSVRDVRNDIAVLETPSAAPAATPGDSSALRPGELVLAIGNPLGFIGALTTGVIHSIGTVPGLGSRTWIQAAVRLAPGNSGGPLANSEGRVVGINTMISRGLGLAVPSKRVGEILFRGRSSPWLGVTIQPVRVRVEGNDRSGLLLLDVAQNSPAALASLMVGDVIVGVNSRSLQGHEDLGDAIEAASGHLRLQFLRGDRARVRDVTVRLAEWRAEAA
jgi:serine protease Do